MDDPRIEALEHRVVLLTDQLLTLSLRLLALVELLARRGVLRADELAAQMAALHDAATFAVEFSPEHEEFRRRRRLIQGGAVSEPDGES
jgi:hypothetical protein